VAGAEQIDFSGQQASSALSREAKAI